MAVLVINHGIIKSIRIITAIVRPMIKLEVDICCDCYCQEQSACWPFIRSFQYSLRGIWTAYTTFHTICHKNKILVACRKGINELQMLCIRFKAVEIIKLCYMSLADWMKWDLTLTICAHTWYRFEHVISNVGRCFSIPLSRSPLCMPQMLWTKCCFAA